MSFVSRSSIQSLVTPGGLSVNQRPVSPISYGTGQRWRQQQRQRADGLLPASLGDDSSDAAAAVQSRRRQRPRRQGRLRAADTLISSSGAEEGAYGEEGEVPDNEDASWQGSEGASWQGSEDAGEAAGEEVRAGAPPSGTGSGGADAGPVASPAALPSAPAAAGPEPSGTAAAAGPAPAPSPASTGPFIGLGLLGADGGFDEVDDIRGPRIDPGWVPTRSVATLPLGTLSSAHAPLDREGKPVMRLIVDSWWHLYHSNRPTEQQVLMQQQGIGHVAAAEPARLPVFRGGPGAPDSPVAALLGGADLKWGRPVEAAAAIASAEPILAQGRSGNAFRSVLAAPPPPSQCFPLQNGILVHPLTSSSQQTRSMRQFESGPLLRSGADTGGYLQQLMLAAPPAQVPVPADPATPAADAITAASLGARDKLHGAVASGVYPPAATEDPSPLLRVLLWYRLVHEEAVADPTAQFHAAHVTSPSERSMLFAQMGPSSRERYCRHPGAFHGNFVPEKACDGSVQEPPAHFPYCNRALAPIQIVSFDCALLESQAAHGDIVWNIQTLDAGGVVITHNEGRWEAPMDVQVIEYDELATTGTAVYPNAAGHFYNEILPRLVHLDATLPVHIPLLWPNGDMPQRAKEDFLREGILDSRRTFIPSPGRSLIRAKRLYTYLSDYPAGGQPLLLQPSQRLLATLLHTAILRRIAERSPGRPRVTSVPAPGQGADSLGLTNGILVLQRAPDRARTLINHNDLVAALRVALPGIPLDTFEPGFGEGTSSYMDVGERVFSACLIIGPHGANMNNLLSARPGCSVVEVGYPDLPSDFFCLSRNLGLRYWLSIALSGEYGTPLQADVPEIVAIAKQTFQALGMA